MHFDLAALEQQLTLDFDLQGLEEACLELGINPESLRQDTIEIMARELLTYLNRRERVGDLVAYCRQVRPDKNWDLTLSAGTLNETFLEEVGLDDATRSRIRTDQYELYRDVWAGLFGLKTAGDELWELASQERVANFAFHLHAAAKQVGQNAILFDGADYDALTAVLGAFGNFHAGKMRLVDIASVDDENYLYVSGDIRDQIVANGKLKEEYEALLDGVQAGFREQLIVLVGP